MGAAAWTHLGGNNSPERLENVGTTTPEILAMFSEAIKTFPEMKLHEGLDYHIGSDLIFMGIEPSYFGDNLEIVTIARDKAQSTIETGHAFGMYGSGIRSRKKSYSEFKRPTRFTKFIDAWHGKVFAMSQK